MDFSYSSTQEELRSAVRSFVEAKVEPSAEERSRASRWDPELWGSIGDQRWPGVIIPAQYEGMGQGAIEHSIIVEEFCKCDASLGGALNLVQQAAMAILAYGTEEQKRIYLPMIARGRTFCITGITEAGAGSKFSDIKTTAVRERGNWILNGAKSEVHVPEHVRVCLIFAKTGDTVSAFLVDTKIPGFRIGRSREIIGMRAMPMSEIAFNDCVLEPDALLGGEGNGFQVFLKSFDFTRVGNAAKAIGIAEGAIARAIAYARERHVGDNVVTDFQGIRWQLAEFATRLEAARLLMLKAAMEYDETGRSTLLSSQAKLFACQLAMEATTAALQITGSYGCFSQQPFARYMMDAKVSQITGGTIEVMKNMIARTILGPGGKS
jgi:alkylation response protein AidB-like acyl-CoA dehydrogenase